MTKEVIAKAILNGRLPSDELGKGGILMSTYIPAIIIFGGGLACCFAPISSVTPFHKLTFLSFGIAIFLVTIYLSVNERRLTSILTNLKHAENVILIEEIASAEQWKFVTRKRNYQVLHIKHKKGFRDLKLVVIPSDKELLINLRNRGVFSDKRLPYPMGWEKPVLRRIITKIQNSAAKRK